MTVFALRQFNLYFIIDALFWVSQIIQKVENTQKMLGKQKIQKTLYQNYRQFIQFINDQCISSSISFILIYLPSITIFGDLLVHVDQGQFWHNIASLSFSNVVVNFILNIDWLLTLVKVIVLFFLLFPVLLALIIVVWSVVLANKDEQLGIGYFYKKYNGSLVCRLIRIYICSFQKIMFPILISLGIKLQLSQHIAKSPVSGILVMVAGLLNSLVFHYFNLQIPSTKQANNPNKQINFPNVALENILIMSTIIVVNATSGIAPFIVCLALFLLRTITSNVLRYEAGQIFYETQFALFCGSAISLALFTGYFTNQYTVMAICACIGIFLLAQGKTNSPQTKNQYQPIENYLEQKETTIEDIKQLVRRQKITKAFKEAVLISRKKISHRDQLTIDILKNKCFALQCNSRSSVKTVNSQELLTYEVRIIKILKKFLIIQQKSIQTLKLIKNKQPKQELLIKKVVELATLIDQNKQQFIKCLKINSLATQITVLMELFFRQLYNDSIFLREVMSSMREETYTQNHKLIQKQLFSKDTALVVINVLDEVGKISKVSNNMQNVLGYTSHSLIGLSINQLIPITIRQVHDNILNKFIYNFSSQIARNKPSVEFYAYDKMFHLQKVQVRYKFFLQFFHNFQLSGVIKQLKTEDYVIILDQFGNIEGWTAQIGELFNFDQISGTDCQSYNIMPMLPSYAKYDNDSALCFRTIFFRLSKMKNQKLILFDRRKNISSPEQIKKKQIQVFMNLLKQGEIIQGYLVNVQSQILRIKSCNKIMKVLKIIDIKRVQNFQRLETAILGSNDEANNGFIPGNGFDLNHLHQDKSFEESYDADFSIAHTNNRIDIHTDLNFTLDFNNPNVIEASQLKFSKDLDRLQSVFSSRSLLKIDIQDEKQQLMLTNQNLTIESTFDPKLQRKNSFIWTIILIGIIQISILIESQVSLSILFSQFQKDKVQLLKSNRAQMIYCKTVFNPNETYIKQFKQGNLLVYGSWLLDKNFTYISFDGSPITENIFYLLNVQIPSTLNRILRLSNQDSKYRSQLEKNFNNVILAYEKLYVQFKQQWKMDLDSFQMQSTYKLGAIGVGVVIYLVFLIFIYKRYKNQRKLTEAFFKFENSDIDIKISNIRRISEAIEKRCEEWFIDQYLNQIKKNNNPKKQVTKQSPAQTHADINIKKQVQTGLSQQDISQRKIGDQTLNQQEVQIVKKRLYFFVSLVVVLLLTQIVFLILEGVLTRSTLYSFSTMMKKIDDASKLSVYPNLKMASLFYPTPADILSQYEDSVNDVLNQPSEVMPQLFQLLKQKPCSNCPFLSEVLSTNYRSFYSYFIQIMQTANSSMNLTDIYYAVDVVTANVNRNLSTKVIPDHSLIVLLYVFSLIILFYGVFIVLRDLESECQKLQCFLKFFDGESLTKNKHMSTIMAKNI